MSDDFKIDDIFKGFIGDKKGVPTDFLDGIFGKKKSPEDEYETKVREAFAQKTKEAYDVYLNEDTALKERYERANEKVSGGSFMDKVLPLDDLPFELPFKMPQNHAVKTEEFGSEYMNSEKSVERMQDMYKMTSKFFGMMNPEMNELMDKSMGKFEEAKEHARKRDSMVKYVMDTPSYHHESIDEITISDEQYEGAARHVFPTREDYISTMTAGSATDMMMDMIDVIGDAPNGLPKDMGDVFGNMRELRDLKVLLKERVAERQADKIYN